MTLVTALQRLAQSLLVGSLLVIAGNSQAVERVTYYHNDALGSPVAATDASGTLLWREEYAPYGERLKKEAGSKDTAWYTGKQEESTFGISYFGARWYDPAIGRFMGVDPVGFDPGNINSFSKYAYANNNPYLYVDPDGRAAVEAIGPMVFGIGTIIFIDSAMRPGHQQRMDSLVQGWKALTEGSGDGDGGSNEAGETGDIGKKAEDSGKNEKHGDDGRALSKAEKQSQELKKKLEKATGRESKQIKQKIKNIEQTARKKSKGEEHSRRGK